MDPIAKTHVAHGFAPNVKPLRVRPATRVPIGRGQEQEHLVTFRESGSSHFDGPGGGAEKGLYWRAITDDLLKGASQKGRLAAQQGPLLRPGGKTMQRVPNPVNGRVEPGCEQRAHEHGGL